MRDAPALFRTLLRAARTDGRVDSKERELLFRYGQGMGLSLEEAGRLIEEAGGEADLPVDPLEKEWFATALADLVHVDGVVRPEERAFLARTLPRLGIEDVEYFLRERAPAPAGSGGRDLRAEGHVQAIAFWYQLGTVVPVTLGGILWVSGIRSWLPQSPVRWTFFLASAVAVAAFLYWLGRGLYEYDRRARVLAALSSFLLPTVAYALHLTGHRGWAPWTIGGALWAVATIFALYSPRATAIFTPEYLARVQKTPDARPDMFRSPLFWVPAILWALPLILGLR